MTNGQRAIKFGMTHGPCLSLALLAGVLAPDLVPDFLVHNLWVELPLTATGVLAGEYVGHRISMPKGQKPSIGEYFSNLSNPRNLLRTSAYFGGSMLLHMLVFGGAHFGHDHFHAGHDHSDHPNFAPHLPYADHPPH